MRRSKRTYVHITYPDTIQTDRLPTAEFALCLGKGSEYALQEAKRCSSFEIGLSRNRVALGNLLPIKRSRCRIRDAQCTRPHGRYRRLSIRSLWEFTADNLGENEKRIQVTLGSPKYREKMAGYTELWITGSREILRIA